MPQMNVQPVPIQSPGPLPPATIGLILGRGSLTLQGLIVYPGIVDPYHKKEFQVLRSSPRGMFSIKQGDRIAQLVLLPSPGDRENYTSQKRAMGSTGNDSAYLAIPLDERPTMKLLVNGKEFEGITDTGADKSIISLHWWPKSWPTVVSSHSLQSLGYQSSPAISAVALVWWSTEGRQGCFTPYVLPLPVNLWGRDVLQAMGMTLTNEYSPQTSSIMTKMGYIPGRGLGRREQGRIEPIEQKGNQSGKGLGFI
ncbi:endogenous retrovirus group K member 7 Pro protein-like [Cricetulus griseus]|uniref:endogenous retrovirus group K member 7 Pro protein-like n=1 Tax=Cricetulus griseus TaxID=10029 RepID=UPI0007DAA48D|nr:endogenous retrovirus group K member 7 Pro protein-like [Cricetulus griseus]